MALCFIAYRLCPNKKMNYFLMIHLELFELYWTQLKHLVKRSENSIKTELQLLKQLAINI